MVRKGPSARNIFSSLNDKTAPFLSCVESVTELMKKLVRARREKVSTSGKSFFMAGATAGGFVAEGCPEGAASVFASVTRGRRSALEFNPAELRSNLVY